MTGAADVLIVPLPALAHADKAIAVRKVEVSRIIPVKFCLNETPYMILSGTEFGRAEKEKKRGPNRAPLLVHDLVS